MSWLIFYPVTLRAAFHASRAMVEALIAFVAISLIFVGI